MDAGQHKSRPEGRQKGFVMWIHETSVGTLSTTYDPKVKKYALCLNDDCSGYYSSPEAAADDVYAQHSGFEEIDNLPFDEIDEFSDNLGCWEKWDD